MLPDIEDRLLLPPDGEPPVVTVEPPEALPAGDANEPNGFHLIMAQIQELHEKLLEIYEADTQSRAAQPAWKGNRQGWLWPVRDGSRLQMLTLANAFKACVKNIYNYIYIYLYCGCA